MPTSDRQPAAGHLSLSLEQLQCVRLGRRQRRSGTDRVQHWLAVAVARNDVAGAAGNCLDVG